MRMQPPTGALFWVFLSIQFTCCSSIPVTKFIGYPFNAQGIFPSNDDRSLTVGLRQSVMVNRTNYTAIHINNNGVLNFKNRTTAYAPQPFPINGNEYIAPLWTDINTEVYYCPEIINTVFYQEFTSKTSDSSRVFKTINKMVESSTDFRALSGCAKVSFQTMWAFAVTWREVKYYGETCDKYNDFQVVLATDGRLTFAIMNYARVDVGSRPPMVGVNAGDGANFRTHPNAMTADIYNIESEPGNTGELGQWVYRIDVIGNQGVRIPWSPNDSYIRLVPSAGTIFGGTAVRIVYPCVHYLQDIICGFGNSEVHGIYLRSEQQFLCVTPEFRDNSTGRVSFTLTFTDYSHYLGIQRITLRSIFYKNFFDEHVSFIAEQMPVPFGRNVTVTWKPSFLSVRNYQAYKVNIELYEYLIDGSLKYIATLVTNASNSGLAAVVLPTFKTSSAISLIFVKITPAHFHTRFKRGSNIGGGIPGAWHGIMVDAYNSDFECINWQSEPDGSTLLNVVEPCPPTENRVREENSNFYLVDPNNPATQPCFGVDIEKILNHSFHHGEADVCFLQRELEPGTTAGNHCCYKGGNLCRHKGCGGTINKVAPINEGKCREHFFEDILPAINCKSSYLQKRPIDDGSRYKPPCSPGRGYGDPHFVTLDGHRYTFNGRGEFLLIGTQKRDFILQGRMIRAVGPGLSATVFSAIVGKGTNSDTVQIELDPFGELVALVNGEEVNFEELSTLEFRNVIVTNRGSQTISATFACGAYIKVKKEIGISSAFIVSLPKAFMGLTHGLMGNYNGNTNDDLIPKGSTTPISLESTWQVIHEQFGVTWIISNQTESLFTNSDSKSWADYYDPLFSPVFQPTFSDQNLEANARRICSGDSSCLFDIAVTNRIDIGVSSLNESQNHNRTVEFLLPIVCNPECGHGQCVENDTCSCDAGYRGDLCTELDVGPCDVNICQNGGRCTRVSDTQRCDCREGYVGDRCETGTATPDVSFLRYFSLGILISWRTSTNHAIEMYRFTVLDITLRNMHSTVLNLEFSNQTCAYFLTPIHGQRYFVQVEARVDDHYGTSGTVEFTY